MRKARFTEGEIVAILREADRELVLAVAKRNRISEQTIYSWRKRRSAAEAARLKKLVPSESSRSR
jgi:putative transposase